MKTEHHLDLPRRLQIEFSGVVQRHIDGTGGEVTPAQIGEIFAREYIDGHQLDRAVVLTGCAVSAADDKVELVADAVVHGTARQLAGTGNGPIDALVKGLSDADIDLQVLDYASHAMSPGGDARSAAYVEAEVGGAVFWGVGVDTDIATASLRAVVAAANRALR
jgi:2-isopropylmalate synthase